MINTYLKSAWRNLKRNKIFSFINIFGLALSMSLCLVILAHFRNQLSYDDFHKESDKIARIITELHSKEGQEYRTASTPLPLATAIQKNYKGIETLSQIFPAGDQKLGLSKKSLTLRSTFTDPAFFDVFSFQLLKGNALNALNNPNSIVLSQTGAKKLFGTGEAMDQTVHFEKFGDFKVTGILKDSSVKSHISFEAYLSMSTVPALEKEGKLAPALEVWNNWSAGYIYAKLKDGYTRTSLQSSLNKIAADIKSLSKLQGKENIIFEIQPFDKIILGEELQFPLGDVGSKGKSAAELLIGFVILLSACFNYTNLSIARSLKRGREVGIRKVAGALRWQVFGQFLMESMINAILAFVLSYVFLSLMIDYMPFIAGGMSKTVIFDDPAILIWYISFCLFTGLLAGLIPALALSSFKPVEVLKNLTHVKLFGGIGLRKSLIVSQFAIALIITIFAGVFTKQFQYMATADPGYNRENMLAIPLQGTDSRYLSDELRNLNGVKKVSAVSKTLGRGSSGKTLVKFNPGKDPFQIDHFDVDSNFVSISGLKFAGGTGFSNESVTTNESEVLINENLMRLIGYKSPVEATGKSLLLDDSANVVITGVLKDFHFGGMDFPVTALLLRNRSSQFSMVQVKTENTTPVIETSVQAIWKRINPAQSFNSYWLKERLYEQQSATDMVSTLGFLAFMTITIAILGLLGMVIYITQTREKEIGIRKVMGAGVSAIMILLSKGFLKLILIAGAIAIPLSYIASYFFLNIFATRMSLSATTLLPGFIGILLLTLSTICWQVYKVAVANPVTSLRNE